MQKCSVLNWLHSIYQRDVWTCVSLQNGQIIYVSSAIVIFGVVLMKEKMIDKHSYAIKMLLFFITSCRKALSILRQFKKWLHSEKRFRLVQLQFICIYCCYSLFCRYGWRANQATLSSSKRFIVCWKKNGKKCYLERRLKKTHICIFSSEIITSLIRWKCEANLRCM